MAKKETLQERWDKDGMTDNRGVENCSGCKGCRFADKHGAGYQKAWCEKFNGENFKPMSVLDGGECDLFEK